MLRLNKKITIVFTGVHDGIWCVALAADDVESQRRELAQKYKNAEPGESFCWSYHLPFITRIFNDGFAINRTSMPSAWFAV